MKDCRALKVSQVPSKQVTTGCGGGEIIPRENSRVGGGLRLCGARDRMTCAAGKAVTEDCIREREGD